MQNSVAVGTAERGLSPSRMSVPGKCSGPLGDSEHVPDRLVSNLKICPSLRYIRAAVLLTVLRSFRAKAAPLAGCLDCEQPILLLLACR